MKLNCRGGGKKAVFREIDSKTNRCRKLEISFACISHIDSLHYLHLSNINLKCELGVTT